MTAKIWLPSNHPVLKTRIEELAALKRACRISSFDSPEGAAADFQLDRFLTWLKETYTSMTFYYVVDARAAA